LLGARRITRYAFALAPRQIARDADVLGREKGRKSSPTTARAACRRCRIAAAAWESGP
jgi:hypothetical protein